MSVRLFSSFIKKNKNHCVNCINYIKYRYTYPRDETYESVPKLGSCSIFGKQNLVTGEIEYEDALSCRVNNSKCGEKGRHFLEIIHLKMPSNM